jgi:hypothetical protein
MKFLLLLSVLFLFAGCEAPEECPETASSDSSQKEDRPLSTTCSTEPEPAPNPNPDPEGDVPNEAFQFDASILFTNFEREQEEKVHQAIDIIKKVIASREFRKRVYNFTYEGERKFVDNLGYSNEQIYQILLNGSEDLKPDIDHEMDLDLELYYSWRNTVGYTYPDGLRIWMNTKFFNVYTPSEVAGNVFHEWTHKLGFIHDAQYSVKRDSSVPYALGYLIEELGKQYE